ncbi:hypothetical protein BDK51DRAFT_53149 [Blyttiomyces helicus]|uniref:Uncharacterized protein n=1 Tax=Blyttiomyces helicus TaxID=388810 RepID=A0A4P9WTF7_9FUNG|nr:hypothetical protein BDK51DRAFT_53149 [Blyttiomyces helicus]|eukprot:RKO94346.1 hypothetical protein BDK51DRAFT_53149 [Blyttiomyces helicus]
MSDPRTLVSVAIEFAAEALKPYRRTPAAAASLLDTAERACAACQKSLRVSALPGVLNRLNLCRAVTHSAQNGSIPQISEQVSTAMLSCAGMARIPLTWATVPYDVLRRPLGWVETFWPRQRHSTLVSCARAYKAWSLTATEAIWWNAVVGGEVGQGGPARPTTPQQQLSWHFPTSADGLAPDIRKPGADQTISQTLEFLCLSTVALCPNLRYMGIGYTRSAAPLLSVSTLAIIFESCAQFACFHFRRDIYDHGPIGTEEFWNADPMGRAIIEGVHRLKYLFFCSSWGEIDDAINRATVAENSPDLTVLIAADDCHLARIEAVAAGCHLLVCVNLSFCRSNVNDDTVQTLLLTCTAIKELDIFATEVTVITVNALKSSMIVEMALSELFAVRGSSLQRLRVGEPNWYPGAHLTVSLLDSALSLRHIHLCGVWTAPLISRLSHCLPALRSIKVDEEGFNARTNPRRPGVRLLSAVIVMLLSIIAAFSRARFSKDARNAWMSRTVFPLFVYCSGWEVFATHSGARAEGYGGSQYGGRGGIELKKGEVGSPEERLSTTLAQEEGTSGLRPERLCSGSKASDKRPTSTRRSTGLTHELHSSRDFCKHDFQKRTPLPLNRPGDMQWNSENEIKDGKRTMEQVQKEQPLFGTEDTEIAPGQLFSARGASLTRLRIGEANWRMSPNSH